MEYEILSPLGEKDIAARPLVPRIDSLENKTIGMFYYFFDSHVAILREIERQLKEKYPTLKFSYHQYRIETSEIEHDEIYRPVFEEWLKGVDTVISVYGNIPSPTLYIAYNSAFIERLGKPCVILTGKAGENMARSGASAKGCPEMRILVVDLPHIGFGEGPDIQERFVDGIKAKLPEIVDAMIKPLTEKEKNPSFGQKKQERIVYKGGIEDVNRFLYKSGWSYGMPVIPPTEAAVKEMMSGTDLPPDHIVATLPPMLGKATVEKIAINAVMAGCLPTYMPILIAGVKTMVNPYQKLEGYTCSMGCWEALWILNGPVRKAININTGKAVMSPYYWPNTTIGHALGLIIMNISGVRTGMEEGAALGHEGKFGVCIAENEEISPWEPMHVARHGFKKEDSTIMSFWPNNRAFWQVRGVDAILNTICEHIPAFGFDPGCFFVLSPSVAKDLADAGFTQQTFHDYILEYSRRDIDPGYVDWLVHASHWWTKGQIIPIKGTKTTMRRFFNTDHMVSIVAGSNDFFSFDIGAYGGGGDHGGPVIEKIELPANWNELVKKYDDIIPHYGRY